MAPVILFDQPDDACCEEKGWVEAIVTEDEARNALAPHCFDGDGELGCRPTGNAKKVWLSPMDDEAERWEPCKPDDEATVNEKAGLEFWEIHIS